MKDFMQTHKLKSYEVKTTKELKNSVLFAWEHYCAWLIKKRWLVLVKRQGGDQEVGKRELQDLQNKREKVN